MTKARSLKWTILTSGSTASNGESVPAFGRLYSDIPIVGRKTYGKGSAQGLNYWTRSQKIAIYRTRAQFTVGATGQSPDFVGVLPDFEIPVAPELENGSSYGLSAIESVQLEGLTPRPLNPIMSPSAQQMIRNQQIRERCIDFKKLEASAAARFTTDPEYDYQLEYAAEVLRCL